MLQYKPARFFISSLKLRYSVYDYMYMYIRVLMGYVQVIPS